jgi:hypothetical protein
MAFLDNSGDIILDAVLTDTGRMRLAKGDGSFRVAKFALGDDEIDYSLYNYNNASGSAYFDLEILQTPVLEAFSNNGSSMKSKLISIAKNNLLYLPVVKVNNSAQGGGSETAAAVTLVNNGYVLAVDTDTETYFQTATYDGNNLTQGVLLGRDVRNGKFIKVDQGLDTTEIPVGALDADLTETQYLVEIDNRFASVATKTGVVATPSYIDDDNIATYYFSRGVDTDYVSDLVNDPNALGQVIAGPRGTSLTIKLSANSEVSTSDYLFTTLGTDLTAGFANPTATSVRGILTNIRITGVTTGNTLDIPLMVVKKISP